VASSTGHRSRKRSHSTPHVHWDPSVDALEASRNPGTFSEHLDRHNYERPSTGVPDESIHRERESKKRLRFRESRRVVSATVDPNYPVSNRQTENLYAYVTPASKPHRASNGGKRRASVVEGEGWPESWYYLGGEGSDAGREPLFLGRRRERHGRDIEECSWEREERERERREMERERERMRRVAEGRGLRRMSGFWRG
jgi:hypothetical protein